MPIIVYTFVRYGRRYERQYTSLLEAARIALSDANTEFCSLVSISDGVTRLTDIMGLQSYIERSELQTMIHMALTTSNEEEKNVCIRTIAEKLSIPIEELEEKSL